MRAQVLVMLMLALRGIAPSLEARSAQSVQDSPGSPTPTRAGDVRAVCDSVAAFWRATGRADVRMVDTTAAVVSDAGPQAGCAVLAVAVAGLAEDQGTRLYWATSDARGWTELTSYTADGPDGSSRTLERDGTRCQVDAAYDGGDDSDPTYVRSPAVREWTFCWRPQG